MEGRRGDERDEREVKERGGGKERGGREKEGVRDGEERKVRG